MGSTMPEASVCVLKYALEHWARRRPDRVFACFEDGERWSYAETLARTRRLAAGLQALGVEQGDHVVVWLPNCKEALLAFFAINYIGGVYVPINTAYRGRLLAHVIDNSDARVILAHGALAARLGDIDRATLEIMVVVGPPPPAIEGIGVLEFEAIQQSDGGLLEPAESAAPIEPWHTQSIIYTSGTTGPSKGVLSSYLHAYSAMNDEAWPCVGAEDRFLVNMPFFHIGGSFITYSMLCRGASIALTEGFRTDRFWQSVRDTDATAVYLLGAMASFVQKAPASPADREHPLKVAIIVPFTTDTEQFAARFGVAVYTLFNMTEVSTPIFSEANPTGSGYCGKARAGFELRVVDENDHELPDGEVGELILRAERPWTLNHGYYKNPEATAQAWRNGWFHTGDAVRRDDAGGYYFLDRKKDAIRRRGENISSAEVEIVVMDHDAVQECAAIGVPSEWGEDDVMVVLALKPGRELAPDDLLDYLRPRMAHFMVPRYLRYMAELPMTPTAKVRKADLRAQGVTEDTWDREAAGIKIKAERLA